jgi:hypothetical protein
MVRTQGGPGLNKSVLFVGTCYYNAWYLSRALRDRGWRATVLTYPGDMSEMYGHGWDVRLDFDGGRMAVPARSAKVLQLFLSHKIIHFTGVHNLRMNYFMDPKRWRTETGSDVRWLKRLGKKIVYTHTACLDGVSQTAFATWGSTPVCNDCPWQHVPSVCSDERNLAWGRLRNSLCDYQVSMGGNRIDYNDDARIHETQQFYCLDPDVWKPDLKIPLIEGLKEEGIPVELVFMRNKTNLEVRYYQAQSDIVCDMLTFGFYGANVREALMLGKPVVCYLRPEWLESIGREHPDFVAELPVVSATPDTVEAVLRDLVAHPEKRRELGRRGRDFALKWYSPANAATVFDRIYTDLIHGPN